MSKINIVLDASKYDMFRVCEKRYDYTYNLNIRQSGSKSEPLDRGTLVHIACEVYYQSLKDGLHYNDAAPKALSKIREAGAILTELSPEMISRVVDTMEEYFDYWRIADQGYTIDEVEQAFMYLLYEDTDLDIRIYMTGKIDLLVTDNQYKGLPIDHKSFDRTWETNRMPNQFKNYCNATKSNYLLVNKIGFQKTLKPHEKFLRIPLSYDHLILEEWKQNVISTIMNNYLTCVLNKTWPMNETSCDKYNRKCEFFAICDSSGIQAKNYKINNDYIVAPEWDVTKIMKKSSEVLTELTK